MCQRSDVLRIKQIHSVRFTGSLKKQHCASTASQVEFSPSSCFLTVLRLSGLSLKEKQSLAVLCLLIVTLYVLFMFLCINTNYTDTYKEARWFSGLPRTFGVGGSNPVSVFRVHMFSPCFDGFLPQSKDIHRCFQWVCSYAL